MTPAQRAPDDHRPQPSSDAEVDGRQQRAIAFRAAPRAAPRPTSWPAGPEERVSMRFDPLQPTLPLLQPTLPLQPIGTDQSPVSHQPPGLWQPDRARHRTAARTPRSPQSIDDPAAPTVVRIARFAPVMTPHDGSPDPARWAVRLAEALLEVLAGLRPPTQLERWLSPTAMAQVADGVRRCAGQERPTLYAVHLHQETARAVEVAAVYGWPNERCAMAFRIAASGHGPATRRGWVCTALTLPPPRPEPQRPEPQRPDPSEPASD